MFKRLHNLQLCTTYQTLLNVLDEASLGHDEKVHNWQDSQLKLLLSPKQPQVKTLAVLHISNNNIQQLQLNVNPDIAAMKFVDTSCMSLPVGFLSLNSSPEAPPYSPISSTCISPEPSVLDPILSPTTPVKGMETPLCPWFDIFHPNFFHYK